MNKAREEPSCENDGRPAEPSVRTEPLGWVVVGRDEQGRKWVVVDESQERAWLESQDEASLSCDEMENARFPGCTYTVEPVGAEMCGELFPSDQDYGTPRVSLTAARELVAEIERLIEEPDDFVYDFDAGSRWAAKATRLGGHALARVVWWSVRADVTAKYETAVIDRLLVRAAHRWLARIEREAAG